MKDLQGAMAEEKLYVADRMKQINTSLIERIKSFGYETLEEYFEEKRNFLYLQTEFNLVEEPMPNGVAEIFKMVNSNKAGILFVDWEDTYVVCANQGLKEFNKQYCEENNIKFFPLYTGGGTIVGSKGDFSFGICYPKNIANDSSHALNGVKDILQKHTDRTVSVNGNDILVDGNKICGSATYSKDDVFMVIMHFSFNDWSELISKICLTSKTGKPVGYVDFMTREEFKKEVLEWLL